MLHGTERITLVKLICRTMVRYVVAIHLVALFGCAQTRQFTPTPTTVRIELQGLPANVVEVQVNDLRGQLTESDSLGLILREEIARSLSASPASPIKSRYDLPALLYWSRLARHSTIISLHHFDQVAGPRSSAT